MKFDEDTVVIIVGMLAMLGMVGYIAYLDHALTHLGETK